MTEGQVPEPRATQNFFFQAVSEFAASSSPCLYVSWKLSVFVCCYLFEKLSWLEISVTQLRAKTCLETEGSCISS